MCGIPHSISVAAAALPRATIIHSDAELAILYPAYLLGHCYNGNVLLLCAWQKFKLTVSKNSNL